MAGIENLPKPHFEPVVQQVEASTQMGHLALPKLRLISEQGKVPQELASKTTMTRTRLKVNQTYSVNPKLIMVYTGSTSGIWSRVASAAGSLTVNVGKAWAANLTLDSGEGNI